MTERLLPGKVPWDLVAGHLSGRRPGVRLGPGVGEDAAVVEIGGEFWALASDPVSFTAHDAGRLAVLVNANDVAVRGAQPTFFTAVVMLSPEEATEQRVADILDQIQAECDRVGAALVGGHTEVTPELPHSMVVGTMLGRIPGRAITTSGLRPGDRVGLTRSAGIEGTEILLASFAGRVAELDLPTRPSTSASWRLAVVDESLAMASVEGVSALHDVTEGGIGEAVSEMERAAGVRIVVDPGAVPVHPLTAELCRRLGLDPIGLIGSGAVLVGCADGATDDVERAIERLGVPLTWIGRAEAGDAPAPGPRLPRFPRDEIVRLTRFSRLRGVLFDMDGTLVDSHYDWPAIRAELGMPDGDFINGISARAEPDRSRLWQRLEEIEHQATVNATLVPGAGEAVELLQRRRVPTALVTNNSERNARACLERFGLSFDVVITRDSGMAKPSGAPFLAAAAALGLGCDEILAVGDSRHDLAAALEAGCGVVCVVGDGHRMGHRPADLSFDSVAELLGTLDLLF